MANDITSINILLISLLNQDNIKLSKILTKLTPINILKSAILFKDIPLINLNDISKSEKNTTNII